MKEIEIELEVESFDELHSKLDFSSVEPAYTTCWYYNQEVTKQGEIIRVRRTKFDGKETWDIGYKSKIEDVNGVQVRDEITVDVEGKEILDFLKSIYGEPFFGGDCVTKKQMFEGVKVRTTDTDARGTHINYIEFEGKKEDVERVFKEFNLKGTVLKQSAAIELMKRAGVL